MTGEAANVIPIGASAPKGMPAHFLEAEAAVISACLLEPSHVATVRDLLAPEHFFASSNRHVWAAILRLHEAKRAIDPVAVAAELSAEGRLQDVGGIPYLSKVVDSTPAIGNVFDHARIVFERWQLRELRARCQTIVAFCEQGATAATREVLDRARRTIVDITDRDPSGGASGGSLKDAVTAMVTAIQKAGAEGRTTVGYPTGFKDLDKKTTGFLPGQLWIVAARPRQGKSSLAMNIAVNVGAPPEDGPASGVLVFSLEMSKAELALRMICAEAGLDSNKVMRGEVGLASYAKQAQWLAAANIWIDDTKGLQIADLKSRARRQCDAWKARGIVPRLIVVDYAQLVRTPPVKGQSREQEVSIVARELKNLAGDLGVTVLAPAQLNRGPEERTGKLARPRLSDLRESGELENAADTVIFIHHEKEHRGKALLVVAKQRSGPSDCVVPLAWNPIATRFSDIAYGDIPPHWTEQ